MLVKRIGVLSLLLALAVLLAGCTTRQAEEGQENLPEPDSGQGEENAPPEQEKAVTWTLDEETGTLTFTGTGPLALEKAEDTDDVTYSWAHLAGRVSRIVIGEGITRVPDSAFFGFSAVTEVSLPSTLESIGRLAFCECAFVTIQLPDSLQELSLGVFSDCRQLRVCEIPPGVSVLPEGLFQECVQLRKLILHDGLKVMEEGCLWGADSLERLVIPASVERVEELSSSGLREVFFLGNPPELVAYYPGQYNFLYAGTAYYPPGNDLWLPILEQHADPYFSWAEGTPDTVAPPPAPAETVSWTFDEGTLTFTGTGPLAQAEALLPGEDAYGWSALADQVTAITIGDGISRVPDFAFYGFNHVTEVSLPSTLETMGMFAFAHCAFQELRLPESLEELEPGAFAGCRQLRSCTVPAGVSTLSQILFHDCESLRQLELTEGLVWLKPGCLFGTDRLETVTLPATVGEVGRFFSPGLREVVLLGDPPEILYPRDRLPYFLEGGTVYYPAGNPAWLPVVQQYQSPQITWVEGTPAAR